MSPRPAPAPHRPSGQALPWRVVHNHDRRDDGAPIPRPNLTTVEHTTAITAPDPGRPYQPQPDVLRPIPVPMSPEISGTPTTEPAGHLEGRPSARGARRTPIKVARSTVVGAALTAAITALMTACAGTPVEPAPRSSATAIKIPTPVVDPSATTSIGPTPSATPPPFDVLANMPPAAKEHTAKGAEAFARYFFEAAAVVEISPTSGNFNKLCSSDTAFCLSTEENIRWLNQKRLHVSAPSSTLTSLKTLGSTGTPPDRVVFAATLRELNTRLLDGDGNDSGQWTTPEDASFNLELMWSGSGWLVHRMQTIR